MVTISVTRDVVVMDDEIPIEVLGLPPSSPVSVSAFHLPDRHGWLSFGHFVADDDGRLSLGSAPSLGGTWRGRRKMGLFTSLFQLPTKHAGARLMSKGDASAVWSYDIHVWQGHLDWNEIYTLHLPFEYFATKAPISGFFDRTFLAKAEVQRTHLDPKVTRMEVTTSFGGMKLGGVLFVPPGAGPFPAVVDIYGALPVLMEGRAALLARRGFLSFAVRQTAAPELELESALDATPAYYSAVVDWLASHPKALAGGVGMMGSSAGSQNCILVALRNPRVRAMVGINGLSPLYADPDTEDNYLIHKFTRGLDGFDKDGLWRIGNAGLIRRRGGSVARRPMPLLRHGHRLRVLMILGMAEDTHDSAEIRQQLQQQFSDSGKADELRCSLYYGQGHVIEPPFYQPTISSGLFAHSKYASPVQKLLDSTINSWSSAPDYLNNEKEQVQLWAEIFEFFKTELRSNVTYSKL